MTQLDRIEDMESAIRCTTGAMQFVVGSEQIGDVAAGWVDEGFSSDEAAAWWDAGVFTAEAADDLRTYDVDPQDVDGDCPRLAGYSWGYAFANGDVSINDVLRMKADSTKINI